MKGWATSKMQYMTIIYRSVLTESVIGRKVARKVFMFIFSSSFTILS